MSLDTIVAGLTQQAREAAARSAVDSVSRTDILRMVDKHFAFIVRHYAMRYGLDPNKTRIAIEIDVRGACKLRILDESFLDQLDTPRA